MSRIKAGDVAKQPRPKPKPQPTRAERMERTIRAEQERQARNPTTKVKT